MRARAGALEWRLWMDGAIAALGTAALGTAFIFDFVVTQTEGTALQVATTLAYPLGDIVLFSFVVGVTALTRWRPGRAWSLLLVGLAALAVADVAYTLQETEPRTAGRPLGRSDLPDRRHLSGSPGVAIAHPQSSSARIDSAAGAS